MDLDQFEGHTPGPWEAKEKRDHESLEGSHWIKCHEGALGYWRGHKPGHMDCRWVLNEKDARLIAAAPDLLAEVRRLTAEADALRRERDELAARLAEIDRAEPVAVVGETYSLLWAQPGTMPEIVRRCGIKVGSLLYARPATAAAPEEAAAELRRGLAGMGVRLIERELSDPARKMPRIPCATAAAPELCGGPSDDQ